MLPAEIWVEVLSYLPLKDLLRSRSVCKLFNAISKFENVLARVLSEHFDHPLKNSWIETLEIYSRFSGQYNRKTEFTETRYYDALELMHGQNIALALSVCSRDLYRIDLLTGEKTLINLDNNAVDFTISNRNQIVILDINELLSVYDIDMKPLRKYQLQDLWINSDWCGLTMVDDEIILYFKDGYYQMTNDIAKKFEHNLGCGFINITKEHLFVETWSDITVLDRKTGQALATISTNCDVIGTYQDRLVLSCFNYDCIKLLYLDGDTIKMESLDIPGSPTTCMNDHFIIDVTNRTSIYNLKTGKLLAQLDIFGPGSYYFTGTTLLQTVTLDAMISHISYSWE
jgi:hypothetical protein